MVNAVVAMSSHEGLAGNSANALFVLNQALSLSYELSLNLDQKLLLFLFTTPLFQ
jgi:hypothetical protein